MSLKSILLFAPAESTAAEAGPAAYAIALAAAYKASLTVFAVSLDVTTPGKRADPVACGAAIGNAARLAGVASVVITEHSHAIGIHEVLAEHARHHDLAVLGCCDQGMISERAIAEHLLFDSGRPLIIVPADFRGEAPGAFAVAWDNTPAAARALGDAKPLIGDRQVTFLTIDGDKQLQADMSIDDVLAAAARRGMRANAASAVRGNRTIGEALQNESLVQGADMLIMGGYGHSTFRRVVLGSATGDILSEPLMPVLISH